MSHKKIALSVIVPVYNEEESVGMFYQKLLPVLKSLKRTYEIIFIDDGSTDSSFDILKRFRRKNKKVKIISFRRNFGKSAALAIGFKEAKGEIVVTMDADLQDRPDQMAKFLRKIAAGYDLVCGWRYRRKDSLFKILGSLVFNKITAVSIGNSLHDINCGFKAFKKEVVKALKVYGEFHRLIPVLAYWQGFRVGEVKIKHSPRKLGQSKFGWGKGLSGLFDLLTAMFLFRYISKPLHIFGLVGLLSFLLGSLIITFFGLRKYLFGILIGAGRPIIQIAVFLMIFGVQVFIFGLLAEIIISNRKQDDQYLIREKIG